MVAPFDPGEIAEIRAATPGCRPEMVHLNHAGSSLPPQVVLDTQISHLHLEADIGGYEAARAKVDRDQAVKASIAAMIGAQGHEIARFESAASAWIEAFWSIPMEPGQRIVVHDHEYGANAVTFLHAAATRGVVIDRIPNDASGQVDVASIAERLTAPDEVALVSLTWVPTNGGLVNPAAEVGRLAREAGVVFLVDACQAVGQLDVDVRRVGCDLLSATGRKFLRGPRGTGFLYVRDDIAERLTPSHPDHHGADWTTADTYEFAPGAQRFEHWEYSHANWLGLGAAVDHATAWGLDRIQATVFERGDQLRALLGDLPDGLGVEVYDLGVERCGIVTFATDRRPAIEIQHELGRRGINVSTTAVDSSRYDVEARDLPPLVRMSVHCTTTPDELDHAVDAVRTILSS